MMRLLHEDHLDVGDPVSQLADFPRQGGVVTLQMGNVLGGLAQDGGLVELVCGG